MRRSGKMGLESREDGLIEMVGFASVDSPSIN